jgi:F-type H+-transporting ATPase subunit a
VTDKAVEKPRRRFGFWRWIVLALIILEIVLTGIIPPVSPATSLVAEPLTEPLFGNFAITNTMVAVLVADILLILGALAVNRAYQKVGDNAPKGIAGIFEMIVESLYNLVENVAGSKWARTIFPVMATILLLVITVNLMKVLPIFETFGKVEESHAEGHLVNNMRVVGPFAIQTPVPKGEHGEFHIIPYLRGGSTDVNFTLAIALIAMTSVQIVGFRANGFGYLGKFIAVRNFLKLWVKENIGAFDMLMPLIDIFVGILELIAEIARIISFTFRLFGSMFAGTILVAVIGGLFTVLQAPFLFLEIFFAAIQAFVFSMLTLVFMSMATASHGHDEGGHEESHTPAAATAD